MHDPKQTTPKNEPSDPKKNPFSDEDLEMIDKWLDENKELMDDLVESGD